MKRFKLNIIFLMVLLISLTFTSCSKEPGTKEFLSTKNDGIEVYKYWLSNGDYVYVSKFKKQPNIITTTWEESTGKTEVTKANVVIFENDSIIVYQKNPDGK